jgi:hypothetical protein
VKRAANIFVAAIVLVIGAVVLHVSFWERFN